MSTLLFDHIIFGPIRSRRLGISLGVNLLPTDGKRCSFDCVYCECGLNAERPSRAALPRREEVRAALEEKLTAMRAEGLLPDVITFAGNGEPTMHPDFGGIIADTIEARDRLAPAAKISVLSNATMLHRKAVVDALRRVDNPILKLDSVLDERIRQINVPASSGFCFERLLGQLCAFEGAAIIQTMFLHGEINGVPIDNLTETEVAGWLDALRQIRPRQVMIYTIDRETPIQSLRKASPTELDAIAERARALGFEVSVAY